MSNKATFIAVLAASTMLATGATFAATQMSPASTTPATQGQTAADKDFTKLSADGSRAYQDIVMTRLAIFDGRVDDAKKYANEADQAFTKAKGDESVFTKAEADLKAPGADANASADKTASSNNAAPTDKTAPAGNTASADMKTPKAWLPVDGEIGMDEDFSASPAKAAAVADANKSVASGDRKGAMEKLKLADVNVDVVIAVVPLDQTISDVHQASTLVQGGKYYEASQLLRKVQDSARFDVADINGVPKGAKTDAAKSDATKSGAATPAPATTH